MTSLLSRVKNALSFCSFFMAFLLVVPVFGSEKLHHYNVQLSEDRQTLTVEAHFAGSFPRVLHAAEDEASDYLLYMRVITQHDTIYFEPEGDRVFFRRIAAGVRLEYAVDIARALRHGGRGGARKVGNDFLLPPKLWLWRPAGLRENEDIEIRFNLPRGTKASVPWRAVGTNRYRVGQSPYYWPAQVAFGSFHSDTLDIPGSRLYMAVLDGDPDPDPQDMRKWIQNAAESVCAIYDSYPYPQVQILIIPGRRSREAVPFAMVVRGGGLAVHFYIDPSRPLSEFINDWTATHELCHGVLPYVYRDDAWLSEGMATYYQYILMGRDRRLSEQRTWQKIYDGFRRGIRNATGETLHKSADDMYRLRAFRYVYWSGAAILLRADVELRSQTNGKWSLDKVLEKAGKEALSEKRAWHARELVQIMDRVSGTDVFGDLYSRYLFSKIFPVDEEWLALLGVNVIDGRVYLDDKAPLADIRRQITRRAATFPAATD